MMERFSQKSLDRLSRLFEPPAAPESGVVRREVAEALRDPKRRLGRFVLLGELGRGGTAIVYRAHEPALNRDVALKVLVPDLRTNPGAVRRFLEESRTAAQFHHPNVVAVHEVGMAEDIPYCAMEWMEGGSVGMVKIEPRRAASIVLQVARGLEAAHRQGIIHADVKPSNILLRGATAKLADFGNSRRLLRAGDQPAFAGTPAFMAPEQALGLPSEVDHRTDVFNLGAAFYTMLTGRLPFGSPEEARRGRIKLSGKLPYAKILRKALMRDRLARYQSMAEFRGDLEKRLRPRRYAVAVACVLLAVALGVAAILRPRADPKDSLRALVERSYAFPSDLERRRADFSQGEARVRELLQVRPRDPELRILHGRILMALDRPREAAIALREVDEGLCLEALIRETLRSIPFDHRSPDFLSEAAEKTGLAAFVKNRFPALDQLLNEKDGQAIPLLEKMRGVSAGVALLRGFARQLWGVDEPRDCRVDYDLVLGIDPWWPEGRLYYGHAELDNAQWSSAETAADHALRLREGWADALLLRGGALLCAGKSRDACTALEQAYALDPSRADLLHDLALARLDLGLLDDALKLIKSAKQPATGDAALLYLLALIRAKQGGPGMALDALKRAWDAAKRNEFITERPQPYSVENQAIERLYHTFALHELRLARDRFPRIGGR